MKLKYGVLIFAAIWYSFIMFTVPIVVKINHVRGAAFVSTVVGALLWKELSGDAPPEERKK